MRQTTYFIGVGLRFGPVLAAVVAPAIGHLFPSVIGTSPGQSSQGTDRPEAT